jgi:hypothetical protein
LRIVLEALRTTYQWPVLSHVRRELHTLHGRSLETLEAALEEQLVVDFAHRDDGRVRLTVAGLWAIDRAAPELRDFVSALRRCYDLYARANLGSPSDPSPVVVSAAELLGDLSYDERDGALAVVGLLLDVERIGELKPAPGDDASPFRIALDSSILAYGRVGRVPDYLEVRRSRAGGPHLS